MKINYENRIPFFYYKHTFVVQTLSLKHCDLTDWTILANMSIVASGDYQHANIHSDRGKKQLRQFDVGS